MNAPTTTQDLISHEDEDVVALFPKFRHLPDHAQLAPLRLPLCLPQGTAGTNSAFTRAYNQELRASGIEMDDWLRFVDGLNIAMSASPPLRVVELAGMIIGFVPYHWAIIAGAGIQFVAETGIHIIAKTLTDRYLRRANEGYFAPRGLRVRICRTPAMRQLIGRDATPDPDAGQSMTSKTANFAKGAGRVAETVVLHLPIARMIYNRVAPSPPSIEPGTTGGMTARRLGVLEGHALPLSFDVPPPTPEEGIMDKASGLSVRLQTWRASQAEAKVDRKRQILAIQEGRATSLTPRSSQTSSGSSQNVLTQAWDWRQSRKDDRAVRRSARRGNYGRVNRNLRAKVEIADRKEWNATDRLLWVVLLNAEQDEQIQGRELADEDVDVEEITEEEWLEEMKYENAEDKYLIEKQGQSHSGRYP